ncbi:hypothetical protein C5F47_03325 [Nitrosopumilus cobalaminigenes]|uniref:Uncharacterized protein n=1 Tax=Nitrosopumilus cobalaminigenes TaxID=1470066 RepID=A0A7D5QZS1_9ARCH|nr:hypothetical protein C5F47_03325 [Nitrosopumilus cobalaminigenes]
MFIPTAYAQEEGKSNGNIDYGILVASITAIGLFGGFVLNAFVNRSQTKTKYLNIVNDYQEKFKKLNEEEPKLITKMDCDTYATNFLNVLDSMIFAESKKWIPSSVLDYFKTGEFRYGVTLLNWWNCDHEEINQNLQSKKKSEDLWPELHRWLKENPIAPLSPEEYLPPQLTNEKYSHLPIVDQQHYQQIRQDHIHQLRMLVNDKELLVCYNVDKIPEGHNEETLEVSQLNTIERKIFNFFILELDLYERVFVAKDAGLLEEDEWVLWLEWFKMFKNNWIFEFAFKRMAHIFHPEMMDVVGKEIFGIENDKMKEIRGKNKQQYS